MEISHWYSMGLQNRVVFDKGPLWFEKINSGPVNKEDTLENHLKLNTKTQGLLSNWWKCHFALSKMPSYIP